MKNELNRFNVVKFTCLDKKSRDFSNPREFFISRQPPFSDPFFLTINIKTFI